MSHCIMLHAKVIKTWLSSLISSDVAIPIWLPAHCLKEQVGQSADKYGIWSRCVAGGHSKMLLFIELGFV